MSKGLRKLLAYALAVGLIVYLARGLSFHEFVSALRGVKTWWFIAASLGSVAFWFFGETFLFSKLFSYFHVPTSFREMLPGNAAQYFLQSVNQAAGGAALVTYMRRRKGVPLFSAGATMVFMSLIDFLVMGLMGLLAAILVPDSLVGKNWYYAALLTAGLGLCAWFWLRGRPSSTIGRWIYDRPSLLSFRNARVSHYMRLILIRAPIFAMQGVLLYFQLLSFGVHVPFRQVMAFEPAELFLSAFPFTPAGLGVLQAVIVLGFGSYGSRAALLTMGLAISTMGILLRLPMGIGSAGAFARELIRGRKPQPAPQPE